MERDLEIVAGGKKVWLNGFVKTIVLNTVLALLGSLHDVEMESELRITVGPGRREPHPAD